MERQKSSPRPSWQDATVRRRSSARCASWGGWRSPYPRADIGWATGSITHVWAQEQGVGSTALLTQRLWTRYGGRQSTCVFLIFPFVFSAVLSHFSGRCLVVPFLRVDCPQFFGVPFGVLRPVRRCGG